MAERNPPERVLHKMGDADDPEADGSEIEEWIDGPGADPLVRQDDDVRALLLDDSREVIEGSEPGDARCVLHRIRR
jgi:hypothetical protein